MFIHIHRSAIRLSSLSFCSNNPTRACAERMQASRSLQPCRGLLNAPTCLNAAHRRSTSLAATAAPSRAAAAEQTAAKAAKVREQLRQHSSKHARQIHEQNVAIAELQQATARRAAQQAAQRQQEAAEEQQPWPEQRRIQEQQQLRQQQERQQSDQQQQRYQQQKLPLTLRNRQQLFPGGAVQQSTDQSALHQHQHQQQQQQNKQSQPQEGFNRLLQEVEVLARSEDMRDWQTAALQCRGVLVPSVSGPQQAAAAWHLMVGLAGRQLTRHAQGALGGAAATLVQVSLAHNDFSMLQRLLNSNRRFVIGPRQLRDLVSVAAAAGADSGLLADLLELAPPCQLSSRAFFVVATTCFNRRHYAEAGQVLARLQGLGVRLSPGLVRLQQAARAALQQTAAPASR